MDTSDKEVYDMSDMNVTFHITLQETFSFIACAVLNLKQINNDALELLHYIIWAYITAYVAQFL